MVQRIQCFNFLHFRLRKVLKNRGNFLLNMDKKFIFAPVISHLVFKVW